MKNSIVDTRNHTPVAPIPRWTVGFQDEPHRVKSELHMQALLVRWFWEAYPQYRICTFPSQARPKDLAPEADFQNSALGGSLSDSGNLGVPTHQEEKEIKPRATRGRKSGPVPDGTQKMRSLLFHNMNNARSIAAAVKLGSSGMVAGLPDLFLAVPAGGWPGLYIELKYGKNKPGEEQHQVMNALRAQGYRVEWINSLEDGKELIKSYIAGNG